MPSLTCIGVVSLSGRQRCRHRQPTAMAARIMTPWRYPVNVALWTLRTTCAGTLPLAERVASHGCRAGTTGDWSAAEQRIVHTDYAPRIVAYKKPTLC